MNKKILYKAIIIFIFILILLLLLSDNIFATKVNTNITIGNKLKKEAEPVGNQIVGAIKVIGVFVAVAMTMIIGIKYMISGVEEKAEYKKTAFAYLLGATLIFAATGVISFIEKLIN